jgi:rhodanese-related sulfurtransferase
MSFLPYTIALLVTSATIADERPNEDELPSDIAVKIAEREQVSREVLLKIQRNKAARESIVLVDARSDSETSVSIIPGAITMEQYRQQKEKHKGKTVIAYCLSGGRSGKLVRQLKGEGVRAVDLEGSILGWCKAELPLTTLDGKPTNRVNTYGNPVPDKYVSVQ